MNLKGFLLYVFLGKPPAGGDFPDGGVALSGSFFLSVGCAVGFFYYLIDRQSLFAILFLAGAVLFGYDVFRRSRSRDG